MIASVPYQQFSLRYWKIFQFYATHRLVKFHVREAIRFGESRQWP
jgi:hypothetical protein